MTVTTPFVKPSPDWDMVRLVWYGTHLDGSPALGQIELSYDGRGPMLDDDPSAPVSIFSSRVSIKIEPLAFVIDGEPRTVGYVSVDVPVSNDPDIQGAGATYSFSEKLVKGGGRQNVHFLADKDAPNGIIFLNKVAGIEEVPGEPVSVVTYAELNALTARVAQVEAVGAWHTGDGAVHRLWTAPSGVALELAAPFAQDGDLLVYIP